MADTVLITGGAGFIGSHITDHLLDHGYDVVVYDNLSEQTHSGMPEYANPEAEYVVADVRDRERLTRAVERADVVCHQAAAVGVGQSMYEVEEFVDVNALGTATLLDVVADNGGDLSKLVVASSMTVYGEGTYYCPDCDVKRYPGFRGKETLARQEWELPCPECGTEMESAPIHESKPKSPTSVYGITKRNQEELCFNVGSAYDVPTVALRYFGVYGERQSLDNPYTGVCSVFAQRLVNDKPPIVFEDGRQQRDFVHVSDVARMNRLVVESDDVDGQAINVGSGEPTTIIDVADTMLSVFGKQDAITPELKHNSRIGDVRHGYADLSRARDLVGFEPAVSFDEGMERLFRWSREREAEDTFDAALDELDDQNVFVSDRN